ncbi:MAG: glycosyltransferase family 2 protein [Rhodobacterales bacterium]|nr:glycosyltransferase family 2 protein [Puniceibacterium antarcticum]
MPLAGAVICGAVLALQLCLIAVRISASAYLPNRGPDHTVEVDPFFSVHVATHDEPPDMVIKTLQSLDEQNWPHSGYEVIVMDNNTADPELWRPVEKWCNGRGPTFRYLHQDDVKGAKAGALNIALAQSRSEATHVVTVDADYQVSADFLKASQSALTRTGADYVQFPQAYAHSQGRLKGVDAELEEYFRSSAEVGDGAESVLLTGTLCVVSKAALIACGGWSGRTTTEDAEMGVRLCQAGFSGRYISQVVGMGYLPFSLRDLEKQRHRWASGNLQTLLLHLPIILGCKSSLPSRKRIALLAQLTAWLNVSLLPALVLLIGLLTGAANNFVVLLAATTVFLGLGELVWRILDRGLRDRQALGTILGALASRLALAPASASATFDTMAGRRFQFVVTDKCVATDADHGRIPVQHTIMLALALLCLPAAYHAGFVVLAATISLMLTWPAAALTSAQLKSYRKAVTGLKQEFMT